MSNHTKLIAIEGADGAGKATFAAHLQKYLSQIGKSATVVSFPCYDETIAGTALGNFLSGRSYSPDDPKVVATLYALDRFEYFSARNFRFETDYVIFDRFTASNVAYQCAKIVPDHRKNLADWIIHLETVMYSLPIVSLNIYLNTPRHISQRNVLLKSKRSYTDEKLDVHEANQHLQDSIVETYRVISCDSKLGPWLDVATSYNGEMVPAEEIVMAHIDKILEF